MSCSEDRHICIWNYETYELVKTLYVRKTSAKLSIAHILNTKLILSGDFSDIIIWNYETFEVVHLFKGHT